MYHWHAVCFILSRTNDNSWVVTGRLQRHEGISAGRKTVFATMSASMHTDLEDGGDVRPTSRRRRVSCTFVVGMKS